MKKRYIFVIFVMIAALASSHNVESLPYSTPRKLSIYMPEHWHVHECEECLSGYMCRYEEWVPSVYIYKYPIWVFGISNEQQIGGILNFRPYPEYDCPQACTEDIPVLYTAEVVYVPPWNPDFSMEDVPLTLIPPGKYVVTSPSFLVGDDTLWYFPDDGTGARSMSAFLYTEKQQYSQDDTVKLVLEITDNYTEAHVRADTIVGEIVLPDQTVRTISTDMWSWNNENLQYECAYNLKNDAGKYSSPRDGVYRPSVIVKKARYHEAVASSEFNVVLEGIGEFDCKLSEVEMYHLADIYSPYMCFYRGFWGEEKYFPTNVELILDNSTFWDFDILGSKRVYEYDIASNKAAFISSGIYTSSEYYLDLNSAGCEIESRILGEQGKKNVYYRVVCHRYEEHMYIAIQYWFFYIFNDHLNNHEGEWEMIEVLLDYETREPRGAAYSRHEWGEYRPWNEIEKKGTHPVVYIAEGSHAAYFSEGIFGYENNFDIASNDGWTGTPESLPSMSHKEWLKFAGNWGYRIRPVVDWLLCFLWNSGPHGPKFQGDKWSSPIEWAFSYEHNSPEILRAPYVLFSLSCPANMLVVDSAGRELGYEDGEFVQEIPNSYAQDCDEEKAYAVTGVDEYTVKISGTGEGAFDFLCSINSWDNTEVLKYNDVPVSPTTEATLCLTSDFCMEVDSNRDDITDFDVFPESVQLSCQRPILPLLTGTGMDFEITLANQGEPSDFVLDVNTPTAWIYSLSSDIVSLERGEVTTVLLTVISPQETLLRDYTINVRAMSLRDSRMTANLGLIASSRPELVAEAMSVTSEGKDVILEALVLNTGLQYAENVAVQFFNGPPSDGNLLGKQVIEVSSGDTVTSSVHCSLPDGLYTFYAVIDPDNTILESCESNNDLSIECLIDREAPEAEIFFDLESEDLKAIGVDNLDSSVTVSAAEQTMRNEVIRVYTLVDDAGNTTEVQLEIKHQKHEIKAEIIDLKYNNIQAKIPHNSFKIEYIVESSRAKELNQYLVVGNTKIHLIYRVNENQTKINVNGSQQISAGLVLVVIKTGSEEFKYRFKIV